MIKDKKELKQIIEEDKRVFDEYVNQNYRSSMFLKLTKDHLYENFKYVMLLRKTQYYYFRCNTLGGGRRYFNIAFYTYYTRKKNRMGNKLGFYIPASAEIGKGLLIYHHGTLIINGNAKIGKYAKFHGNNCIGNSGISTKVPKIGDNVELGFGASIIGNVKIDNNTTIGAGAVVVHSTDKENETLVGVPARKK